VTRRESFLTLLAQDIRKSGHAARVVRGSDGRPDLRVAFEIRAKRILEHTKALRAAQLGRIADDLLAWERAGIGELLGDAREIDPARVDVCVRPCRTEADHRLFRYCQGYQRVPSHGRVGRRLRFAVFDIGQARQFVVGVIELASSPYAVACRDRLLGWGGVRRKTLKDAGLRMLMDVATCIAVPPYNALRAGKLLAALSVSRPVVQAVRRQYGSPLHGVVSTVATGIHSPLFNRIMLRRGGLFRRIGQTSGFSAVHLSPETLRAARMFLPGYRSPQTGEFSLSVRPLRVVGHALRQCGISGRAFLKTGIQKGVYFAETGSDGLACLRAGRPRRPRGVLEPSEVLNYWRTRVVPGALATPTKRFEFLSLHRETLLLSRAAMVGTHGQ
jgi:hypothetical protein